LENKEKMLKIITNEKYPEICIIKRKFGGSRVSNNIDDPARDRLGKHNNVLEMTAINIAYPYETFLRSTYVQNGINFHCLCKLKQDSPTTRLFSENTGIAELVLEIACSAGDEVAVNLLRTTKQVKGWTLAHLKKQPGPSPPPPPISTRGDPSRPQSRIVSDDVWHHGSAVDAAKAPFVAVIALLEH
jgi:hypothetical protein